LAHDHETLIQAAIDSDQPVQQLRSVALRLKVDGHSQRFIYELFDAFRVRLLDGESPVYDHVLDTMDLIVGWCSPENAIFDEPIPDDEPPT